MKVIVAILMKDAKMLYVKDVVVVNEADKATEFNSVSRAENIIKCHCLYPTIYPLQWIILEKRENEYVIKKQIIHKL